VPDSRQTDSRFVFAAGQWVDFFAPGVDQIGGYSIASPPSLLQSSGLLQLVVSCPRLLLSHTRTQLQPLPIPTRPQPHPAVENVQCIGHALSGTTPSEP
jgi:hypothetical protein